MCLIIHKPAHAPIPKSLICAAAMLNPDGWGLMGFGEGNSLLLHRREWVEVDELWFAQQTSSTSRRRGGA